LNSPQTALFDKSSTLYGLDLAQSAIREHNLAVIVEGYMDVIGAHQGGFKNVVASLGTALTEKQLGLLKRLTNRYALALDPDAAGEEATKRGLEVARQALDRKTVPVPIGAGLVGFEERLDAELLVIPMPPGKDPDELIHAEPQKWSELAAHPEPLVDFYFRVLTQDLDLKNARDKSTAVKRLVPIIREVGNAVQRAHYAQRLARLVQVSEQTIAQQIETKKRGARTETQLVEPSPTQRGASKIEEYCLTLALHTPEHLARIEFLEAEDFGDSACRALFTALREFWTPTELYDREAFRAMLDETLGQLHDRLIGQGIPDLSEPDLAREIENTAHRLRLQRAKTELAQIEVLLRDQDETRTASDIVALQARVDWLRKRLMDSQKALSARTIPNRI
jgi:DNA primase